MIITDLQYRYKDEFEFQFEFEFEFEVEFLVREGSNEEEVWNCRSVSDRLCPRISTTDSGLIEEIWGQQRPEVQTLLVVTNDP